MTTNNFFFPSLGNPEQFDGYFIIIAGQSNGTDRFTVAGNLPAALQGVQQNSYTYFKTADTYSNNGSWVKMETGVNTQTGTPQAGKFGVGLIIANRLFNTYKKTAYVVPTAIGGAYLANDVTPSWYSTHIAEHYKRMVEGHVHNAYLKIRATKKLKPVLIWIQGESDADTVAHGNAYQTGLTELINNTRTYTGFKNLPVIIVKLRADYVGPPNLGLTGVRQAMVNVANTLSNVFLFNTDNNRYPLSSDGQHYNPVVESYNGTQSVINMGDDLADFIDQHVKKIDQSKYWSQGLVRKNTDSEASALISAMTSAPDTNRQEIIKNFFINYKAQSEISELTSQFGFLAFLAAHDAQAARLWWNDPSKLMTTGGTAPTFTTDRGYKNSGNGWINSLFNPSTGTNYSQNNGGVFVYVRDNIAENNTDIGIIDATTVVHIQSRSAVNSCNISVNQGGSMSYIHTDSRGLWHTRRLASDYVELYHNGVFVKGGNNVSLTLNNGNIYILAFNDTTSAPMQFSTKQIALAGTCNNSVDPVLFYNNVQNYMTAIGANV